MRGLFLLTKESYKEDYFTPTGKGEMKTLCDEVISSVYFE